MRVFHLFSAGPVKHSTPLSIIKGYMATGQSPNLVVAACVLEHFIEHVE
jgi:hypothetical protein